MSKLNFNPSKKELRVFGIVILVGFGILGAFLFHYQRKDLAQGMWAVSAAVALLALVFPAAARPIYLLWMGIGIIIGFVVSRIVMSLIFFGMMTPVALFFRWRGRDILKVKKPAVSSYWNEHERIEEKTYYEHLF